MMKARKPEYLHREVFYSCLLLRKQETRSRPLPEARNECPEYQVWLGFVPCRNALLDRSSSATEVLVEADKGEDQLSFGLASNAVRRSVRELGIFEELYRGLRFFRRR